MAVEAAILRHYHPVYAAWHCGDTDGVLCTNPKDVNCPECVERAKG